MNVGQLAGKKKEMISLQHKVFETYYAPFPRPPVSSCEQPR